VPSGVSQYQAGNIGPGVIMLQGENLSVIVSSISAAELQELTRAAAAGAVGPIADNIVDLSQKLGVTWGAMRTMLAAVGQSGVPDEKLTEKLTEVFEQNRKAAEAIAALRPDNPVVEAYVADAAEAQTRGDREEARRYLRAAREAAEAAAAEARRLASQAETAAGQQMDPQALPGRSLATRRRWQCRVLQHASKGGCATRAAHLHETSAPTRKYATSLRR
jgi:hypothetical protein